MKISKPGMNPREEKELEYLKAKVDQQEAVIDYLAMMCDVELDEEDEAYGDVEVRDED